MSIVSRFEILAVIVLLTSTSFDTGADAATWREGDRVIVSLDEFLAGLGEAKSMTVSSELPPDTPVLLSRDFAGFSVPVVNNALVQNDLATRTPGGRLRVTRADRFADRPTGQNRQHIRQMTSPAADKNEVIATGGAILFGYLVEPPFVVETTPTHVLLNGLRVYPPPGVERTPATVTSRIRSQHELLRRAHGDFARKRDAMDRATAQRMLAAELAADPLVAGAIWTAAEELTVHWRGGGEEVMSFRTSGRSPDPDLRESESEVRELIAIALRDCLARDHTVVCGADYFRTVTETPAAELLPRIREILASPELFELKRCRLQARTEGLRTALDLLAEQEGGRR